MIGIKLFIRELERVIPGDLPVNAAPMVRRWLGEDAVVEAGRPVEGCDWDWPQHLHGHLADVEAAGWALAAARCLYEYDFERAFDLLRDSNEDDACSAYVSRVFALAAGGDA